MGIYKYEMLCAQFQSQRPLTLINANELWAQQQHNQKKKEYIKKSTSVEFWLMAIFFNIVLLHKGLGKNFHLKFLHSYIHRSSEYINLQDQSRWLSSSSYPKVVTPQVVRDVSLI